MREVESFLDWRLVRAMVLGVRVTADRVSEPEDSDDAHPEHLAHSPQPDIGVYVNPFTDFGFKRIFGQPMSRDILIDFLNEVLAGREATITEVTYLNNEQVPGQKDQRRAAFDLHCTTSTGARIIVEMQASYQRHVVERALYYATFAITEQAPRGDWNFRFDRIYSIVIMDFDLPASALSVYISASDNSEKARGRGSGAYVPNSAVEAKSIHTARVKAGPATTASFDSDLVNSAPAAPGKADSSAGPDGHSDRKTTTYPTGTSSNPANKVRHEVMLVNTETGRIMSDRLVLIFLEMRNFVKSEEELETNMDKWLYLLRHLGRLTGMPAALQGRIFKEIFTIAKISAMDTQEYIAYQRSIKSYRDIKSGEISSYELGMEKGEKLGLEKGLEKGEKLGLEKGEKLGLEKGEKPGLEKGLEKGRQSERRNLVQTLNQNGFAVEDIVKATGMSHSEVLSYLGH